MLPRNKYQWPGLGSTNRCAARLVCSVFSIAVAACAESESLAADSPRSANVILISLDTLRADHLGLYGYDRNTSPQMDKFGDEAVVFEQAVAPSSWTMPSHASIFTGLYPSEHGAEALGMPLPESVTTLAELAAEHGYQTAAVTGGRILSPMFGFAQGFEKFVTIDKEASMAFDYAKKWLDTAGEDPFFLFLHTYEIHDPYAPPEEFAKRFVAKDSDDLPTSMRSSLGPGVDGVKSKRLRKHMVDLYDGGIAYTDDVLGKFFQYLRDRDLWDNTVIALFSDHGEEFWDHGRLSHGETLYEEQLHVPLIVKLSGPDRPVGRRSDPVALKDLYGTLVEYMHWQNESISDPPSFLSRFNDHTTPDGPAPAIFSELRYQASRNITQRQRGIQISLRKAHQKLIYDETKGVLPEYYDLKSDPMEKKNIAESKSGNVETFTSEIRTHIVDTSKRAATIPRKRPRKTTVLNEGMREQLRALGYLK